VHRLTIQEPVTINTREKLRTTRHAHSSFMPTVIPLLFSIARNRSYHFTRHYFRLFFIEMTWTSFQRGMSFRTISAIF
jgi:hypothetical protein